MSIKAAILSGVAAAAIGTAALAQSGYDNRYGNGPQESTPAEMQQTGQLNQQQSNAAVSDQVTQAQYHAQYQDQQQQYTDQIQHYQAQQQRYRYDLDRYNANLAAYGWARYYWGYPAPYVYSYGDAYGP
jgi:negative regulator of sigma E activity